MQSWFDSSLRRGLATTAYSVNRWRRQNGILHWFTLDLRSLLAPIRAVESRLRPYARTSWSGCGCEELYRCSLLRIHLGGSTSAPSWTTAQGLSSLPVTLQGLGHFSPHPASLSRWSCSGSAPLLPRPATLRIVVNRGIGLCHSLHCAQAGSPR